MNRRGFMRDAASVAAGLALDAWAGAPPSREPDARKVFRLWALADAHVGTDLKRRRESLAEAIRQSEQGGSEGGPPFDWDIAVDCGDLSGNQGSPQDDEGREVVRQFRVATKHRREDFYSLAGNHDATPAGEPVQGWFRKWVDPAGENTPSSGVKPGRRRYPIEGTWERYSFRVGNLLFLMMSDRNDLPPPVGRGEKGGYPAGAVTGETFRWWQAQVEAHPRSVILSAHHHMLKETTVASGPWEGFQRQKDGTFRSWYHGYYPQGGPEGASYLYFVDGKPDAQAFEHYLRAHPGAIDLWLGGHTHTNPDDRHGGRSHIETKWGCHFINCCALTRYHGAALSRPMSRLLTFTEGSDLLRVQCYLHTSDHAPQGWYPKAERRLRLNRPFERDPVANPASKSEGAPSSTVGARCRRQLPG